MGLRTIILAIVAVAILAISAGAIYYLTKPAPPPITTVIQSITTTAPQTTVTTVVQTTTTTTTLSTHTATVSPTSTAAPVQPRVTDIVSEGFVFVDDELYWRIKILGEVDLRDKIEINGVYSFWFGRFNITLPDGSPQDRIYKPGNYEEIVSQFIYLPGTMTLDIYIPTEWWEKICLEGVYRVVVWLKGPYNNYTVLFDKSFTFKMALNASITPNRWPSWSGPLKLEIDNTGDVPLILNGVGIELTGTETVIGWLAPTLRETVMPGESKTLEAQVQILSDFMEELRGKTRTVDFVLNIVGAPRRYAITIDVEFPRE